MIGVRKDDESIILVPLGSDMYVDGKDFAIGVGGLGLVALWWVGGVHDTDDLRSTMYKSLDSSGS